MTDYSRRVVVAYVYGGCEPPQESNPVPSATAPSKCRNRCCTIPIDAFRTMYVHRQYRCTVKRIQKKSMRQSQIHEMANSKLIKFQIAELSKIGGML